MKPAKEALTPTPPEQPAKEPPKSLEVKLAFLHQSITVPGKIGSERTLSDAKIPGIKMQWTREGLLVEVKKTKAIVPAANVAVAILAE